MANREVNLTKRVQTPLGMRYCRVVLSANGRVRPDYGYAVFGNLNFSALQEIFSDAQTR